MARVKKTNAMRVLDAQDVPYEVITFPDSIHDAIGVADYAGLTHDHVYKTLVAEADESGHKPMLIMVGGDKELDLKKIAAAVGVKKCHMARRADAEKMTGLLAGGISPLALLNRGFDIYIDRPALDLPYIVISAGKRGLNVKLGVDDLIRVTEAQAVDVGA
jgi:Cys-tRNA(Pro)/Cys-tRNA(Cys) deacylase